MKSNIIAISIFSLAIAIILNGWLISSKLTEVEQQKAEEEVEDIILEKQLLTQSELGKYLGITEEESLKIMPKTNGNVTTSKIPYITIGDKYYFSIKAIDKWLTETGAESFR